MFSCWKKKFTHFRYFSTIKGKFRIYPCINIQHSYNMHSVNRQSNLLDTICQGRLTIASLWSQNYKVRIPLHLISQNNFSTEGSYSLSLIFQFVQKVRENSHTLIFIRCIFFKQSVKRLIMSVVLSPSTLAKQTESSFCS